MNWKPGDIGYLVRVGYVHPDCEKFVGSEFEVIRRADREHCDWQLDVQGMPPAHRFFARERHMRRLRPPNELCKWSDVIWQPKELVVTS